MYRRKLIFAALLTAALAGWVRLFYSARAGSEELPGSLHKLKTFTAGYLVDVRTPAEKYPDAQLDFWLPEIERVLQANANAPELFAAAALMVYEPCYLHVTDVSRSALQRKPNPITFAANFPQQIRDPRSTFDQIGRPLTTAWMQQAIELAPRDPRWRRLRAVLLWPSALSSLDGEPTDADWQQVLAAAEQHDPGNALYTVLHANWLSQSAIDLDNQGNMIRGDRESWDRTLELTRRCESFPFLRLGEPAIDGLVRLHSLSHHPVSNTNESVRSRFTANRAAEASAQLALSLLRMSDTKEIQSDPEQRKEILELAEAVTDLTQNRSGPAAQYSPLVAQVRQAVYEAKARFERQQGEITEGTTNALGDAQHHLLSLQRAAIKLNQKASAAVSPSLVAASAISLPLMTTTCGTALVFSLVLCLVGRGSRSKSGSVAGAILLYLLGIAISIFFLGIGPAGLVSTSLQHWVLTGLSLTVLVVLLGGIARRSQLRFRYSIRSLMIASAVVAVLLQSAFLLGIGWEEIGLPIKVHASADPIIALIESSAPNEVRSWLPGPPWISRSTLQWMANQGPGWSVAIYLGFALLSILWSNDVARTVKRNLTATIALMLVWLNMWVWIEPSTYRMSRPKQLRLETYIRSVDEYYSPLEALVAAEASDRYGKM